MTEPSVYDQLGGAPALDAVVTDFYDRVLADPDLTGFFTGVSMPRLIGKQTEFFAAALGGPDPYTGPSMTQIHRGKGIHQDHFDKVATHLGDALTDAGAPAHLVTSVLTTIAPLAPEIVSSKT